MYDTLYMIQYYTVWYWMWTANWAGLQLNVTDRLLRCVKYDGYFQNLLLSRVD